MRIVMTGGHHTSALPVIDILNKEVYGVKIFWLGHKYSVWGDKNETLEYKEICGLGIPFYELRAGKVYNTKNILKLIRVPLGFFQALYFLLKLHPDVIVSFGGYLAVPVVIAGWVLGIPSVTHEQTVVVGWANKVIAKFSNKILISWEDSRKYFNPKKVVLTGIPLRSELFRVGTNNFHVNQDLPTIYITAGKTGSAKINEAISQSLEQLLKRANLIHQTGDHSKYQYFEKLSREYSTIKDKVPGRYIPRKFVLLDEIGEVYSRSDMLVTRAGAHTTSEILALNKPALLIPIPWVSHDEQNQNANIVVNVGLGVILKESEIETRLLDTIDEMLKNLDKYKPNSDKYKNLQENNAARSIAHEILSQAKKS